MNVLPPGMPGMFDDLRTALLGLAHELRGTGIPLVVGGGYGLYLWQSELLRSIEARGTPQTILPVEWWPEARSTQDLDVFLRGEVVTDYARFVAIRAALERLGYAPVDENKYWQFTRQIGGSKHIVVDILTGPVDDYADRVQADKRRVSPKRIPTGQGGPLPPKVTLHARLTKEAVGIEARMREYRVDGVLTSGEMTTAVIEVPHPFPYLLMKLAAYDDRKDDATKELGAHHALDIYRIIAMMTETEFRETCQSWSEFKPDPPLVRAQDIIKRDFHADGLGMQRLRQHPLGRALPEDALARFISALRGTGGGD